MQKLIETLKEFGIEIPAEKQAEVKKALSEHYKNAAEHGKTVTKLEDERDKWKKRAETAEETLRSFEGIDPEKIQKELDDWKEKAQTAEKNAQAQLLQRDQKDFLKSEFDRIGIKSERTRKSLMADIMGEDGLKWKDGKFMGLDDYLKTENEKDHFYQTQEEKELEDKRQGATSKVPKFTEPSKGKAPKPDEQNPFGFHFTSVREEKKG